MVQFIFCLQRDTIIYLQPKTCIYVGLKQYYCGTILSTKESTNVITAYLCSDLSRSSRRLYTDQRTTLHHRHHDTFEGKYLLPSDSIPSLHSKKVSFLVPHAMTDRSSEDVRQECQLLRSVHFSRSRSPDTAGSATEHQVCRRLVDHSDSQLGAHTQYCLTDIAVYVGRLSTIATIIE